MIDEEKDGAEWRANMLIGLRVVSICALLNFSWHLQHERRAVAPLTLQPLRSQVQCSNENAQARPSKDGKHQAILFEGVCGTPEQSYTWVSVLAAGETLMDRDTGNTFGMRGERALRVQWVDDTHLRIEYPESVGSYVNRSKFEMDGVNIQYVGVP